MPHKRQMIIPATTTVLGLVTATLMFALPGEAAPDPSAFSAEVRADVWKVNRLDQDMSGDPVAVGLDVGAVLGQTGSAASPDRSKAFAHNLNAAQPPSGRATAASTATSTADTVGTTTAAGPAGTVPNVVTYGSSVLTARGRWGGDATCLTPETALTQSKVASQATGVAPGPIPAGTPPLLPIPLPTAIPTEVPTTPPSDFPTGLPTDLPTILPTPTGSTTLPTLTTTLPTTLLPKATGAAALAEGDVAMVQVAPASVEERTLLEAIPGSDVMRRVYAEAVGKVATPGSPAVTFFGGEATLKIIGEPKLSAYSDGGTNGSQVTWVPPQMALTVAGTDYAVPTDGTALALPYSQNEDVVLSISAGKLSSAESATGVLAQAAVSVLDIIIKNGDTVALDASLFPMSVKAVAPSGGVDCTPPVITPVSPKLKVGGKDNGPKPDRITINANPKAADAKATVFRKANGKQRKVAGGLVNDRGDRVFKLKDQNGKKPTTYVVRLGASELTLPARDTDRIR